MFEDSTFESGGRIKSKSGLDAVYRHHQRFDSCTAYPDPVDLPRGVAQGCDADAVDRSSATSSSAAATAAARSVHVVHVQSEMMNNQLTAPTRIPQEHHDGDRKGSTAVEFWRSWHGRPGRQRAAASWAASSVAARPKVKAAAAQEGEHLGWRRRGMLLQKTTPVYPPIAKAARVSGTVVLQATISKTGTIENLQVVSGPAMLQQAAMDAVGTGATGRTCSTTSRSRWRPQST